jgi:hypothetical protein
MESLSSQLGKLRAANLSQAEALKTLALGDPSDPA